MIKTRLAYKCFPTKFLSVFQNIFFTDDLWLEFTLLKNHASKIRQRVAKNIDRIALVLEVNSSTRAQSQIYLGKVLTLI